MPSVPALAGRRIRSTIPGQIKGFVEWDQADLDRLQNFVDEIPALANNYLEQDRKGFITEHLNEQLLGCAQSAFPDVPKEQLQALIVDWRFRHFRNHQFENWLPLHLEQRQAEYSEYLKELGRQKQFGQYHGYVEWSEEQAWAVVERAKQVDPTFWDTYCWRMNNIGIYGADIDRFLGFQPRHLFPLPEDVYPGWIDAAVQIFVDKKEHFTMLRPEHQETRKALDYEYRYFRANNLSFLEWCEQSELVKGLKLNGIK
jgi:hypothetical protein